MILNTPAPKLKSNTTTVPITELTLTTDKPILIVLTPFMPKRDGWWIDRKGLLYLNHDGIITWHSDNFIASEPCGKSMTDIVLGFKHLAKEGWNPLLSEDGSVWHELSFGNCDYSADRVLIPVYPSPFTLNN
ncbi:hypothetical protein [Chamaesiphon sp.]|uniref:hypothetical protein n=1 Tax=Chamaesiphon sp. TaxID=2814140 RepID=UPI0035940EDC